jgi:cyclophilin family peptidyl-prolyl cis-trans isomerase
MRSPRPPTPAAAITLVPLPSVGLAVAQQLALVALLTASPYHCTLHVPGSVALALHVTTPLGVVRLALHADRAPATVAHISKLAKDRLFDGSSFYRSDFVIQMGLHGSPTKNPHAPLAVNEATRAGALSNKRGTAAVAHWDVPDCGNSEFFINLQDSSHLDKAYGGYCVFASVDAADAASWATISAIAAAVKSSGKVAVTRVEVV